MTQVFIPPVDVWDFYKLNKTRLEGELVLIAEDDESKTEVYLTSYHGNPLFEVYKENELEYDEFAVTANDCLETSYELYRKYIYPFTQTFSDEDNEDSSDFSEPDDNPFSEASRDEVYEREIALQDAMYDFLYVAMDESDIKMLDEDQSALTAEALDLFLPLLASELSISIWRPMYDTDDMGNEIFVEYPYDELILDGAEDAE